MKAYLALGSNLGDRKENLSVARDRLEANAIHIVASSSVEETEPVGGPPQARYLNQVLEVDTDHQPRALLAVLKQIEVEGGREPGGERWGPREIDIDILLYGHVTIQTPDLTIPHPELLNRDFLVRELGQINPA